MRHRVVLLSLLVLAALVSVLAIVSSPWHPDAKDIAEGETLSMVSPTALPGILAGPHHVPFEVVLWGFGAIHEPGSSRSVEVWHGRMTRRPGSLEATSGTLQVRVAIMDSPRAALEVVDLRLREVAQPPAEVPADSPLRAFSDRAWYAPGYGYGARVIFVHANVVADIHMSNKEGLDPETLFNVARVVGRKIDAALAGTPEPPPILPPSVQELRVESETAWRLRDLGPRAWGAAATTIAVYDANGLPRSLPAKRIGADDYLVPLHHLAAVLGPRALVEQAGGEARVKLLGKELVYRSGAAAMRADGRELALAQPMEFAEGQAIVPLSSVMQAVGRRATWSARDGVPIARLEPAP